jgi:SAM-dependent methyltransferase
MNLKKNPGPKYFTLAVKLRKALRDSNSVLDVGCGSDSPLRFVNKEIYSVGIDLYEPSLKKSQREKIHKEYYKVDVRRIREKFKENQFDAVIALDLIEHLNKKEGYQLLSDIEKIAKKKVVILTPNGFIKQYNKNNPLQEHLSGWVVEDFVRRGYEVSGIYGWRPLRKEEAEIRFRPRWFWGGISEITHYFFTNYVPRYSYSLFAQKNL